VEGYVDITRIPPHKEERTNKAKQAPAGTRPPTKRNQTYLMALDHPRKVKQYKHGTNRKKKLHAHEVWHHNGKTV